MNQTGSGGIGAVSAGIAESAVIVVLAIVVVVVIWFAAKMLLATFRG
jgi:uncharacterized membrane protein YtjA (UPF0391 family)